MKDNKTTMSKHLSSYEPYLLEMRGEKTVNFPERIKDILKNHSHLEFDFKGNKYAVVTFDDFLLLLEKWKKADKKSL